MKFQIEKQTNPNIVNYPTEDFTIAKSFAKRLKNEFGLFLKTVILFGSAARKQASPRGDIDILIVVDDLNIRMTKEVIEAYKLITEKTIGRVSTRLHVTSMTLTSFWEYTRAGDPVAINMIRDGVPLIDTDFFAPLQALLMQGRIRPSDESVWNYFGRAPRTMTNSKWHVTQATLDLYWAVIDSAHAALMKQGAVPPSPEHVADLINEKLVETKLLEKKYANTMDKFYKLMKGITHREIKEITGKEFDAYFKEADDFVKRMKLFLEV